MMTMPKAMVAVLTCTLMPLVARAYPQQASKNAADESGERSRLVGGEHRRAGEGGAEPGRQHD